MGESKFHRYTVMVSFADDDWFRGLVCSMVALGVILIGYATYYGVLLPRWPDYNEYGDDEDEDERLNEKVNDAFAADEETKVNELSETKDDGNLTNEYTEEEL